MDPFSDSGELFNIQRSFYTGDYNQVLETDISGVSAERKAAAQVLVARAKIALGRAQEVVTEYAGNKQPELKIVHALAEYVSGAKEVAVKQAEAVIEQHGNDNAQVQFLGGVILVAEKREEEALKLLGKHQGSLECISLIVQIYLVQNKVDKAEKEVQAAKQWAQDNIVFNLAEAWVHLRRGTDADSQSAFYIFEELTSGTSETAKALNGRAVATFCQPIRTDNLDRQELEQLAEQRGLSLKEALELEPNNGDVLANSIAGAIVQNKEYGDLEARLEKAQSDHPSLVDLKEKSALFDKAVLNKYKSQITAK